MLQYYAPDALVVDRRAIGWGEFPGHDAIRSYYEGLFANVEEIHEGFDIVLEQGDLVVANCHTTAKLAEYADAGEMTFDYALRFEFADGVIALMEIFEDPAAAGAG
jgi:ketosteroid isomerase-like protein